jgi:hypothetical protein
MLTIFSLTHFCILTALDFVFLKRLQSVDAVVQQKSVNLPLLNPVLCISTGTLILSFYCSRQHLVKLDRRTTGRALNFFDEPRTQANQVEHVRATELLTFVNVAETDTALQLSAFRRLDILQFL